MQACALLLKYLFLLGYNVSGSDNNDTETFVRIEKEGAKVYLGQVKENITEDAELVIYTNAILEGNEELEYAKANLPTFEKSSGIGCNKPYFFKLYRNMRNPRKNYGFFYDNADFA